MQSGNDEAVVSLVVDASGLRQGSVEAVALGKRIIDSFKAVEAAAGQVSGVVSVSGAGIIKSLGDTNRFLGQIERSLNPLAAAANKAEVEMKRLIGIMGGSNVEAAQRASVALEFQAKKVLDLKNVIVLASEENKRLEATYLSLERTFQNAIGSLGSLIAKYQPASASAKQMTSELAGLNAAYKAGLIVEENYIAMNARIINSYNDGAVAAQKLVESRAKLIAQGRQDQNAINSQNNFNQVLGVTRPTNTTPINASNSMLGQIGARAEAELENATRDQQILAKAVKDTADRFDYLTIKFNQDATAAKNYRQTIKDLNELMKTGTLDHTNYSAQVNKAIDTYNASTVAGQKAGAENKKFSTSIQELGLNTRLAQYAMTNFSFQINDVVSGLAMGQQPFRIFAQQAGQFVQIFQQIGRENIGTFFKDMGTQIKDFGGALGRWLITPMGLAVTGLTALGVGVSLVIGKILEAETRIRSFGVILRTMGTDGLTSAKALDEVVKGLRDTGSAAKDAQDAVSAIARTPGINPSRVGDISNTSRNISAARGISLSDAAGGLSGAIAGGADELTKYAQSLGIKFNPAEQKAIDLAILHRDKIDQLRIAYGAISRVMSGEYEKSLSQTQRLISAFTEQYNKLLDSIGNTEVFQESIRRLTKLGEIITAAVKGNLEFDIKFTFKFFTDTGLNIPIDNIGNWIKERLSSIEIMSSDKKQVLDATPSRIPTPPVRTLKQLRDSQDEASTFNYRGMSAENLNSRDILAGEPGSVRTNLSVVLSPESITQLVNAMIKVESNNNPNAVSPKGAGGLMQLMPGTAKDLGVSNVFDPVQNVNAGTKYIKQLIDKYGDVQTALMAYNWGPGNVDKFLAGGKTGTVPVETQKYVSKVQGLVSGGGDLTAATGAGKTDLSQQTADINLRTQALNKYALELIQAQAKISAVAEAEQKFKEATPENELLKQEFVTNAVTEATTKFNDELNKGVVVENLRTKGVEDTAKALQKGSVEGLKASAMAEAINRNKTEGISIEEAYRQALASGAAEAAKSAAEQIASQAPVLTGMEKQAAAAKISGKAEHDARIEAEAAAVTQRALDAEKAKGTIITNSLVEALNKEARAQILAKEAAQNSLNTTKELNTAKDSQQVLQLQIGLQAETTEEINRQVALLQKAQELQRDTNGLTETDKKLRFDAVDATQRMNVELANANREQQRLESGIRTIADTIGSTLLTSIENAFSGKKVETWRETVSKALTSLGKQLLDFTLIKPLTGTLLSGMGLTGLGSQFGTFGNSLFGGSSTSTSSNGSVTATLTPDGNGGFSMKQMGDVAGAGKGIFDLFGGSSATSGVRTGVSSFLFGSGAVNSGFAAGTGLGEGIFTNLATGLTSDLVPSVAAAATEGIGGGLLGSLGLGSSLVSGISSAIPFIGPAVGIASMVLPMLFKQKPSDFGSAGNVTFGIDQPSHSAGGGNSANTATANSILKGVEDFGKELVKDTGGKLYADVFAQAGSRDGIKVEGFVGNVNSPTGGGEIRGSFKFGSATEAIEAVSLAMVHYIDGVSETMKKVLSTVTDLDDLDRAIAFAKQYEDLKEAFDSAFSNIEDDKIGPYAQALIDIGIIFDDLTASAVEFGLSLDPINAGLVEANKRLLDDFNKEISDSILAIEDPTESLIQIEKEAGKIRVSDAIAVGADLAEVNRLNGLYLLEITEDASDSVKTIAEFNKEISDDILELLEPFKFLIEQEKDLGKARLDEAIELGADISEVNRLNALILEGIWVDFNKKISDEILALIDPFKSLVQEEKDLGKLRLEEAIAVGGNIVEVNRLNALALDDIWETQTQSLLDLKDELKSGSLSGMTVGEQVRAANDNFQTSLRLVKSGDLNEVENLVTRGRDAFSLSEEAYGNASQTANLRGDILSGVDEIMLGRSFASGTESTPEGWIRVGENGPEWMKQNGGNKILQSGSSPRNDDGQLLVEVRKLNNLLEGGNLISREGFSQTIKKLERVIGGVSKPQTLGQPTRTKVA